MLHFLCEGVLSWTKPFMKMAVHHQGNEYARGLLIALMMEAARTSETLVNFYQTTRRYNTEDSHLRTHRRENLKSELFMFQEIF
jgi:hypothetical protein